LELFFSHLSAYKANHGLRELIYEIRAVRLDIDGDGGAVRLNPDNVICDWHALSSDGRLPHSILRAAQGGILPGYGPSLSEPFTEWLDAFNATLVSDVVRASLREIEFCKSEGDWSKAELAARACLAVDSLNGRATTTLAQSLVLQGSAEQATRILDDYSQQLGDDAKRFAMSVGALRRRIGEISDARLRTRADFSFRGREREMSLLSATLEESRVRGPRGVLLVGEPGIGKSRIATELATRASLDGFAVVRTNAHPTDRGRPMGAFVELVPLLMKQPGALGCSPESMHWLDRLLGRAASLPNEVQTSSDATKSAIARAINDLIAAVAGENPLAVVVDDAQWVDESSLRLLGDLVLGRHTAGVFLLLLSRDEQSKGLTNVWQDGFVAATVGPLAPEITSNLIAEALRAAGETDASLGEWMADTSSGNPFYAESLIDHYRISQQRYSIPYELSSVVDQRVHAVSEGARDVLETIVALGKYATLDRLERALTSHGSLLVRLLRELGDARLIRGDSVVAPAHWLIAESIQRNSVPAAQRILYRRIARVLEQELTTHNDSGESWACAELWVAGGEPQRAATLLTRCAEHAEAIGRAREASDLYFRAADMSVGGDAERAAEQSIRAAMAAIEPLAVLRAMPLLTSRIGNQVHDDIELAEIRARNLTDHNSALSIGRLLVCLSAPSASVEHRLTAARALLGMYDQFGYGHLDADVNRTIAALLEEAEGQYEPLRLVCLMLYHAMFYHPEEIAKVCAQLDTAAGQARADEAVQLLRCAGIGLLRIGRRDEAIAMWIRTVGIAERIGLDRVATDLKLSIASQYLDNGQPDNGREWFSQISCPTWGSGDHRLEYAYLAVAADFALYDGDNAALISLSELSAQLPCDDVSARVKRWRNALSWIGRHARGEQLDTRAAVEELTNEHIVGREIGDVGDFEMTILLSILNAYDRKEMARTEFEKYVGTVRCCNASVAFNLMRIAQLISTE
jgi:tetratricopeptide (TPR) repeat protein